MSSGHEHRKGTAPARSDVSPWNRARCGVCWGATSRSLPVGTCVHLVTTQSTGRDDRRSRVHHSGATALADARTYDRKQLIAEAHRARNRGRQLRAGQRQDRDQTDHGKVGLHGWIPRWLCNWLVEFAPNGDHIEHTRHPWRGGQEASQRISDSISRVYPLGRPGHHLFPGEMASRNPRLGRRRSGGRPSWASPRPRSPWGLRSGPIGPRR